MSGFRVTMKIEGVARTVDTTYGQREERDNLAEFQLEVEPARAFKIFQEALSAAIAPDVLIAFPDGVSEEQRAAWVARFEERHV